MPSPAVRILRAPWSRTSLPYQGSTDLFGHLTAVKSELHFHLHKFRRSPALACVDYPGSASNQNEERVMIALGLVRLIERNSDELVAELIAKLEISSRTTDLRKVPVEELRRGIQEILRHLGEWLLTKTAQDIEKRYWELGERRASQVPPWAEIAEKMKRKIA